MSKIKPNAYLNIYNSWKNKASYEFSYDLFWKHVNIYVDPMDCDAESWALAGKLAYESLVSERFQDCNDGLNH